MNQTPEPHESAGNEISPAVCGQARKHRLSRMIKHALGLSIWLITLIQGNWQTAAESAVFTEYQVKALFLLNFTKYVDWPATAFGQSDSPINIGLIGQNNFGGDLALALLDKSVNGRKVLIVPLETEADWPKCQILFISSSEKKRLPAILAAVRNLPILTVGETESFIQQGGIINFIKKDGKVRLEIALDSAQQAGLQISSKLLIVSDAVRRKH